MENPITDAAFEWLAKADRGLSDDERRELDAWLSADERHLGAYRRAEAALSYMGRVKAFPPASLDNRPVSALAGANENSANENDADETARSGFDRLSSLTKRRAVLGLGGILATGLGTAAYLRNAQSVETQVYKTAVGEVRDVLLADGTAIILDTATEIRVMNGINCEVILIGGKAIFDVAYEPGREFILHALGFTARTGRASLSVQSFVSSLPEMVVRKGALDLTPTAATPIRINAGEKVIVAPRGKVTLTRLQPEETERAFNWRYGRIDFTDTPLQQAIAEFARYGGPEIVLQDPGIGALRITGVFTLGDQAGLVEAVTKIFPLEADYAQDRILISATSQ